MGPVHVDVPHDIAGTEVEVIERALLAPEPAAWLEGASLEAARAMLAKAKNPVILAGLGAVHHGAGAAILALAKAGGIPVLTTYKAKGIIDESHPLCLGGHGLSPKSDTIVLPILRQSDCIILAGYDPIEMRNGWIEPWDAANAIEILHADIQHGMHGAAARFVGGVALGVTALLPAILGKAGGAPKSRAALAEMFAAPDHWGPHQVFDTVLNALPEGGIATADSGAHRILLSQIWGSPSPWWCWSMKH